MTVTDDHTADNAGTADDDTAEWVEDTDTDAEPGDDEHDADDEGEQPKKPGVRQRLKDAEAERDELRSQLSWSRQVAFMEACRAAGLDADVATAKGVRVEDHLDEHGAVDAEGLATALEGARSEAGVPRRPRPVRTAGRAGGVPPEKPATFGEVLREHSKYLRR
ncbi:MULTISPECIES: hypothetical protein [Mycobacterium]|uniref:Uncharacterized protein n=2 Tax=Mycobacterium kiyosense TaxID=2871094 RepID=A0A9P3Q893_9MYCO|nr:MULTISPECIES: hypothetical protein [Mycobacterium]BDB43848.1 hypothetical protein IWGMT90018_42940 [Mycobacterium kiyosense]BDE15405.1 hypothetical protein MKCMC460_42650 [Mycobacterium sp. 20KCMC460]GLB82707.1 hypothetical protein SRL2020028_19630 [Mycobacterium kiyosense]GLB90170.1 hypothetical protein SRL2020130_29870 [Mycobacterium kiyosense]GLB95759.1 hypothetical protein SRL2020226_25350 [Mycobacterium kiyosense]